MPLTVTLPEPLALQLQSRAKVQKVPLGQMVVKMLSSYFEPETEIDLSVEELVAEIKAMPPNPACFRPAQGSLLEALKDVPNEPEIDVESWNREWAAVEAEMKTITRLNDYAEGLV